MKAPLERCLRISALADFLGCGYEEIEEIEEISDRHPEYSIDGEYYMVLTDSEADKLSAEYVADTLWAFNADFLADYCDLPREVFTVLQDRAEGANDTVRKLINRAEGGFPEFVDAAIGADGRGHFLGAYDGEEHTSGEFFIYRTN